MYNSISALCFYMTFSRTFKSPAASPFFPRFPRRCRWALALFFAKVQQAEASRNAHQAAQVLSAIETSSTFSQLRFPVGYVISPSIPYEVRLSPFVA